MTRLYKAIALILAAMGYTATAGTYLDRLKPVLHLRLDKPAAKTVTLDNGRRLTKSPRFPDSIPSLVDGPHPWTGKAWDFAACEGSYTVKVDETMTRVGDIEKTTGMSITFWAKGRYNGRTSRIMTGPFDIGTGRDSVWGGTNDYQNASSRRSTNPWDGRWHSIAVTIDFKAGIDHIRIYIDGKPAGKKSGSYIRNLKTGLGRNWNFGARNANDPGHNFGPLADIAVFDRPLSELEIGYINAGPVYAGPDQTITMPNILKLTGFAPGNAVWRSLDGPGEVRFSDARSTTTQARFAAPGRYRLQLQSGTLRSRLNVNVLANQPPKVFAGDGVVLQGTSMLRLKGAVEDNSVAEGKQVSSVWTAVTLPPGATARFTAPTSPTSEVTFTGSGLYVLRLTATDGETTASSDVSILVNPPKQTSYLKLLHPIFLMGFERPPHTTIDTMLDDIGDSGMKIRRPRNGMPRMTKGAREFTGYAWDFSPSDSDLEIINGEHFIGIHEQQVRGRSVAFWIKGDKSTSGHVCRLFGQVAASCKYGFSAGINGVPAMTFGPGSIFCDGQWHHIAITITTINGRLGRKIYLDGKMVKATEAQIPTPWWVLGSRSLQHSKFIGSRGRSGRDNFNGRLDDFAIFDHALSPEDVAYIINGPTATDRATLEQAATLRLDAGPNRYIQLPAPYAVDLAPTVSNVTGLKPHWAKKRGAGTVAFSDPNVLAPTATFQPVETDKDGKYSKFILRLSLLDGNGREVAGDNVTILFYPKQAPKVRRLTPTPSFGRHPRIFFTKADLPELRRRAMQSPVARRAMEAMRKRTAALNNPGDITGSRYQRILKGGEFSIRSVYGGNGGGFFNPIMEAAYLAWLGENGQSDVTKLRELATVFSRCCRETLSWYRPVHNNALCHDANPAVGIAYDLLHDWMDDAARNDARHLLSRMTSHRHSVGATSGLMTPRASTNWCGYHDHLLPTALAIEGEPGFDVGVVDSTETKDAFFMTQYGIFKSGLPHEGYAYFCFGMTWMSPACYAISRRTGREPLMETTHFYRSIETAFRLLDRSGIRPHHDVVEDGTGAGLIPNPPRQILIAKYLWPEDRMVDCLWARLSTNLMKEQDRRFTFFHAVMGEPVRYPNQTLKQAGAELRPTRFCPDRGFVMARDRWDTDGVRLDFRCRMDKYHLGHVHSDVNSFELWANNRMWIIDRGKFAGVAEEAQSCILIDGAGAFSAKRNAWPSSPGKFVEFRETDLAVIACGDAKPFFEWSKTPPQSGPKIAIKDHGVMWADYYFPRAGEVMPEWMAYSPLSLNPYGVVDPLYKMNPVERAYRTATLIKGRHPFVVIVDDYQKDARPHDYLWMANVPYKEHIVLVSKTQDSLVIRHRDDIDGPYLLVSVIHANGLQSIDLNREPYRIGKDSIPSVRIEIPSKNVIAPDYQILLYPFTKGQPQPVVSQMDGKICVTIGNESTNINLTKRNDGRTAISVDR